MFANKKKKINFLSVVLLSADDEQPGTSGTVISSARSPGVRTRLTPSTSHMSWRIYPANRTKTAESNRLNDALQDQVRTTTQLQTKLTEWLEKNAVILTNARLDFPTSPGTHLRDINAVMEKYLLV